MNFQKFLVMSIYFENYKLYIIVIQNIWHGKPGLVKYTEANPSHRHYFLRKSNFHTPLYTDIFLRASEPHILPF